MKAGILNIRAYRVSRFEGEIAFNSRNEDRPDLGIWFSSIKEMATYSKDEVTRFHYDNRSKLLPHAVVIDLVPYHAIEHVNGFGPLRCFPLTQKEADEFWEHYNS